MVTVEIQLPALPVDATRPAERLTIEVIDVESILGIAAAAWCVLMAVAPLLQIRRMVAW